MARMTRKITGLLCVAGIAIALAMTGCAAKEAPKAAEAPAAAAKKELGKIRIGTMPSTMGVPVQYAVEMGYFKDEGLDVELSMFPSGAPINEAIAAGQLDVAASGLASVFPLANGIASWIGEGNTTGGMGIYVRKDSKLLANKGLVSSKPNMYGSVDTIKGTKFIGPVGTSAQFNVMRYIQQFGMTDKDISMIHMEHGQAYQAFIAGQGDAIASSPPYTYQLAGQGYVLLASFEDATEAPLFDGLLATNSFLQSNPEKVKAFVAGYYRACQAFTDDEKLRFDFSKKWFTANGREPTDQAMNDEIRDRKYVTKALMTAPGYSFGKGMLAIAEFYTADGKIAKENVPNVTKSFYTKAIEELMGIDL